MNLLSSEEIETFIKNKLAQIDKYKNLAEKDIPKCTPDELWMNPSVYKYYANPDKLVRATKNFDSFLEANKHMASKKGIGIVKEVKGKVKRCNWCAGVSNCSQAASYIKQGLLEVA